jgi:hypothetical protein
MDQVIVSRLVLEASGKTTITGPSAPLTISGGNAVQVFDVSGSAALSGLTIAHGKVLGAPGGGISNTGTLSVTGCTFSQNDGGELGGGGIYNDGTLSVTGCTFSQNSAAGSEGGGGGIYNDGTLSVTGCTFSQNSAADSFIGGGGGIYNHGTLKLDSSIVAGNTAPTGPDILGTVTSQGFNLVQNPGDSTGYAGSDQLKFDPLLSALGKYGGPTKTYALLPGSPAIDHGDDSLNTTGATDQRGQPRSTGGHVDVGSFESQGFVLAVHSGSGQSANLNTAFSAPLVVSVTPNNNLEPVNGGQLYGGASGRPVRRLRN